MATDITTIEAVIREDFALATALDGSQFWQVVQTGAGQSIDMTTASALKVNAGTTANAETIIRSRRDYGNPFRVIFLPLGNMLLSQRIINQEVELRVCTADGNEVASWLFDGTLATSVKYRSRNGGTTLPADTTVGVLDTATGASSFEIELFPDEVYWHNRSADNSAARNSSYVRNRQVPNPDLRLFVEMRIRNLATAPASNTVLQLDAVLIQDINEITAEITGGRGGGAASQGVPITAAGGSVTVNANNSAVTPNVVYGATDPITNTNLTASSLYTQPAVDTGTGTAQRPTRLRPTVAHTAGQTPGTLILEESVDNAAWRETWRCPIPSDSSYHTFDVPLHYRYYRWKFQNGTTAQTLMWLSVLAVRGEGSSIDAEKNLLFQLTAGAGQAAAISAVTTFPVLDLGLNHNWDVVRTMIMADQAGTAVIAQSQDNSAWIATSAENLTLTASQPQVVETKIWGRYIRLQHTNNGTTAATALRAAQSLVTR